MKYVKTFRANNISGLEEAEIREKEFMSQMTEFNAEGNPIEVTTYFPDGTVEHKYKYHYSSEGKLLNELLFEGETEITEHRSMEYNAKGQMIKESIHYLDGTADEMCFAYDEEGRILSKRSLNSEGETDSYVVIIYDEDKLFSETEYDIAEEIISQRKIIYDEEGRMSEELFKSIEEDYNVVYSYDEKGQVTLRRRYDAEEQLTERNTYAYDENGRLAETREESNMGVEISTFRYDASGNVVVQEDKAENDEVLSRVERTYDEENRILTLSILSQRPHDQIQQHYRIRTEYE